MQWKKLFEPRILERGREYWREGSVLELEADEDSVSATVEGSEEYEVCIELNGGEIEDMSCTCPYAEDGKRCKHMAAALFAWSEAVEADSAEALVASVDEATLRRFLAEALRRDSGLRARFERLLRPKRAAGALKASCARVDEVVERYMEDGFIDYGDASSFLEEMLEALDEEMDFLLQLKRPRDAFDFVAHVLCALDEVEMDDSGGERFELMDECRGRIEAILDDVCEVDERYIFDRILNFRGGDLAEDVLNQVLWERFDGVYYQRRKLQREREKLDQLAKGNQKDEFVQMEMERCVLRCLELMGKTGAAREEIEALQRQYWRFPDVRQRRMDELKRRRRWAELVEVAKESIALDGREHPGYLPGYHLRLKEAYRKLNDGDAYRAELRALVTRWMPCELSLFREYRALFSAEDWPAERDRLFAALPPYADPGGLFLEEKLYDRLIERAVSEPGLDTLKRYEKHLAGRYPDQVLQKYVRELDAEAKIAAGRDVYRRWAATLRHMRALPGGEEAVQTLVATWRARYPRRAAMLDELKKF